MENWNEFVIQNKEALEKTKRRNDDRCSASLRQMIGKIGATPTLFTSYRTRFNQFCHELKLPKEKQALSRNL